MSGRNSCEYTGAALEKRAVPIFSIGMSENPEISFIIVYAMLLNRNILYT